MSVVLMSFMFVGSDTTAPIVTVISQDRTRMSRVVGQDATMIVFQVGEAYVEYMVRVVPATSSLYDAGTLVEGTTGSWAANTNQTITITDDELVAASAADGDKIVKIFAKDSSGNWSS